MYFIESTLCPTVADWRLSDPGQLVSMVMPSFTEMTLTANASRDMDHATFFHALHSPSIYHPKPLPDSEMFSEAEYVSLKGLKSRSLEEETPWPLEMICKKKSFSGTYSNFLYLKQCFFLVETESYVAICLHFNRFLSPFRVHLLKSPCYFTNSPPN